MKLKTLYLLSATPVLLAACAHIGAPATARAAPTECTQLTARLGDARAREAVAAQRVHDAWKAVIPIAVVAVYAENLSARDQATREVQALQHQQATAGCPLSAG